MRFKLLLFFFLIFCTVLHSQNKITLDINIEDSSSMQKIPYANILLYHKTDTIYCCSDMKGKAVTQVRPGDYEVRIDCIGYKTFSTFANLTHSQNFTVFLSPTNAHLSEVTVLGRAQLIKMTPHGIIYDISKDKKALASDLLSALADVPLVNVDPNNNILVKGSNDYSIYLNGRPWNMAKSNPQEILRGVPASSISKIEIITHVDSKYGAETGNTILNIITKNALMNGYSITMNAGAGTKPSANTGITFSGALKHINFSIGYDYQLDGQHHQPISLQNYYNVGSLKSVILDGKGNGYWHNHVPRILFTWKIDSINSLYIDGHGLIKRTNFKTCWNQIAEDINTHTLKSSYLNDNINWQGTAETNIIYRHFFSKDKESENFSIGYRYTYNPDIRNFHQSFSDNDSINNDTKYTRKTNGGINEHSLTIDICPFLSKSDEFHIGGKQVFRIGNTHFTANDLASNKEVSNEDKYKMNYSQNISALYTSYIHETGKLSEDVSLRWEYTHMKMNAETANYVRCENALFPYFELEYQLSNNKQISLSYKSGIQRPGILSLNPFTNEYSTYTTSEGNPELKNSHTQDIDLNFSSYSNQLYFSLDLSYKKGNHDVISYSKYNEEKEMFEDKFGNDNHSEELGSNIYINYRPWKFCSFTFSGNIFHLHTIWKKYELNQKSFIYNTTLMSDFSLKKNWMFGFQFGKYKNQPDAWGKVKPFSLYSFYLAKSLIKGYLNIKVIANSPFKKYEALRKTKSNIEYTSLQTNYMTARSFAISLSYTIHNGKFKKIKRDRTLQDLDQKTGVE